MDNLEKMGKFLETYNTLRTNKEEKKFWTEKLLQKKIRY